MAKRKKASSDISSSSNEDEDWQENGKKPVLLTHSSLTDNTIKMGDFVILTLLLGKKSSRLAKIEESGDVHFKKERINLKTLIGNQFNSIHQLDRSTRQLKDAGLSHHQLRDILRDVSSSFFELNPENDEKDNRSIMDDGSAQKLNRDDIEKMKQKGATGDEIIKTLAVNSGTFAARNVFSQEKYLKKKQAKYSNLFRVLKPTPSLLSEMYYSQGPMKINNLRFDSMAQMLTQCNVRSGAKFMVIDTNMGILTAAVLDRLVGNGSLFTDSPENTNYGQCVQIFTDDAPVSSWRQSVDALNLPSIAYEKCLASINLRKLYQWEFGTDDDKETMETSGYGDSSQPMTSDKVNDEIECSDNPEKKRKIDDKSRRKANRRREEEKAINSIKNRDMDGLLIVTRSYDPTELLMFLFRFLGPSQPFAVFSLSIDPLLSCYQSLKGFAINCRITETWFRRYQVLESRTRPEMNMSGSGGYILTGIKVD